MKSSPPSFILSRHWTDSEAGIELRFWLIDSEGERRCRVIPEQSSSCFVAQRHLKQWQGLWRRLGISVRVGERTFTSLLGDQVLPVYTHSVRQQRRWVHTGQDQGLKVWEDDVMPANRFLMERFLFGSLSEQEGRFRPASSEPELRVLSLDIETDWYIPGQLPALYSIALAFDDQQQVLVVNDGADFITDDGVDVRLFSTVRDCLAEAIARIQAYDPDCIVGWNVIDFDLRILQEHCDQVGLAFEVGRQRAVPLWREMGGQPGRYALELEGRQVVDGPGAFRSAAWAFEDYSLETVSRSLLNRGKRIEHSDDRVGEIERLYREDLQAFAHYNAEDAQLVLDLFDVAGLWHFLIERSHLTGLPMDRVGGSSAAFNTVYMPRLHRYGYVASSVGEQTLQSSSPGGHVMDSTPGIYRDVIVLDFKSLYPSIIRTFLIDPMGLLEGLNADEAESIPGFLGARFHRTRHILPGLIDQLWAARDQAKREQNAPMSQAIKIIMNSFYGVLGSPLCRFFDPRLASSITMRGHDILQRSSEFIESQGYPVIYGDTDSLFIHARNHAEPKRLGRELADQLNEWWRSLLQESYGLASQLEMEFETHYSRFVMPTIRGTDKGSKKRYAGWIEGDGEPRLVFKGLEAVRSDWTPMAKAFQHRLYRCVFQEEDYRQVIRSTVQQLHAGELDAELVYRRRLRRQIDQYEKQAPPHVQAARLKKQHNPNWFGRTIEYVKTVQGWQPLPYVSAPLDYTHYIEKQLAPIADALLFFFDDDFQAVVDDQMSLF
ncbi:DNA polymerase II [Reinekea blandensis]|uniref:DNA polymerase n=1 Tax=Reinekea blandensis MED297 TaxID=314283 RepID=A4BE79_9GAMM|nr:DNA polymerase II [Reinekea blandensis]EAR09557.1 DNA-directed DNA polymerase B [Reinekea blandensis MED297]